MTAMEPDLSLVAVPGSEAEVSPEPSRLGLVGRALLGSLVGVLLSVVLSLLFLEGSYAGVRDDGATEQAVAAYRPYLEAIGRQLGWLAVGQALCFTPVVLGLLLLLRVQPVLRGATRGRVLLPSALGFLVVYAFGAGVAHRHPGLFLSLLSSSSWLSWSAGIGHLLVVLVFGAAALGYVFTALRPRQRWYVSLACAAAILLPLGAWLAALLLPGPVSVFGREELAGTAGAPGSAGSTGAAAKPAMPAAPPPKEALPNVLVLAVDSLRPDMIDAQNTPHLHGLLAESVYFPNALVTQPRTGPSWAATLTSLPPLLNGVETMFPSAQLSQLQNFSLPAHLGSLGYRTAVFSEYAGEFFSRVNFGFHVSSVPNVELEDITGQMLMMRVPSLLAATSAFYTQGPAGRAVLGKRLNNLVRGMANFAWPTVLEDDMLALAQLERQRASESGAGQPPPFFWLTFYSQPHFPYTSSSDFYSDYTVEGSASALRFGRDAANETPITSEADKRQLLGLYRAALAQTDAAVGQLLGRLRSARLLDDTIIVLLSDHGEGLYECATCVGHGDNLKSLVTLRVPLAFRLPAARFPDAKAAVNEGYVSQLDVYPTLLSLLQQAAPPHHMGVPLLDRRGQQRPLPERVHFAETGEWLWPTPAVPADRIAYPVITELARLERGRIVIDSKHNPEIRAAKQRAAIRPPYKLSYEPGATQVQLRLYQLENDPWEQEDLAAREPEVVAELKQALFRSMLRHPQVLSVADYFLTRPEPPPPESW